VRLDKFLKVSRLIKRRTLAKEVCAQGRVTRNGTVAKASTSVAPGDELSIRLGQKRITVRVEKVNDTPRKGEAAELYTLLSEERIDADV
jgi:ribosomal 50S subunit-recycling heat shock protein